ncbi:MAG: amino acid ABC transporter permease [Deltaproteobacteria bacterium]|nr:amino acid ABC transporter permease [Deltaproteobacteria bacterium]
MAENFNLHKNLRVLLIQDILMDIGKFTLILAVISWLMIRGTEALHYNWQWYQIPKYIFQIKDGRLVAGPLMQGLSKTLQISGISLFLALAFGLITAVFRLSNSFIAKGLARLYLELTRNTPLLVQLFFIYFVLSPILDVSRFASAVLALSLFEGAYISEIFRSGMVSIHKGQWEAAYSLGLNPYRTFLHIILPQAIRRMLPPLTSQAVSLVKDSALVSTVAIYELTMHGRAIIAETYLTFEIWFTVAGLYLLATLTLSIIVHKMEKRFRIEV